MPTFAFTNFWWSKVNYANNDNTNILHIYSQNQNFLTITNKNISLFFLFFSSLVVGCFFSGVILHYPLGSRNIRTAKKIDTDGKFNTFPVSFPCMETLERCVEGLQKVNSGLIYLYTKRIQYFSLSVEFCGDY